MNMNELINSVYDAEFDLFAVHFWSCRCVGESLPGNWPQLCVFFSEGVGESV